MPASGPALREREVEFAALRAALTAAEHGSGHAVFIVAEAGRGKTALLDWMAGITAADVRVARASGSVMETNLPFAYAEQFVDVLRDGRMSESVSTADPLSLRAFVHDVARAQLREWAQSGPALVILDDLQWADPDSMDLIGFLARRLDRLPVAFVGSMRQWPPRALTVADALAREGAADVLDVHPLSRDAAGELVMDLVGASVEPELLDRAHALADGNPMLVSEAARSIREGGELPQRGDGGIGRIQRMLLLSHLAAVPADAVECARAVAILGTRVRIADVQAVAGLAPGRFASAFDAAVSAGVLQAAEPGWAVFTHDLLATALYDDTSPAHRHQLHTGAFEHFLERGDMALAAPHALAAGMSDDRAIAVVREAGQQAIREGAVESGLAQLAAAVAVSGAHPKDELLAAQADAFFAVGMPERALEVYDRLLARPASPTELTGLLMRKARAQGHAGALEEARDAYDRLLANADELGDNLLAVVLERAHVVWEMDGPAVALDGLNASAGPFADAEPVAVTRAYFQLGTGDPTGLAVIERAGSAARHRMAVDPDAAITTMNALTLLASAWGMVERVEDALELIDGSVAWLRSAGALRSTVPLRVTKMGMLLARGELFAALAEADDLEEELELDQLVRQHIAVFRAQTLIGLGRTDEARLVCEETAELPGPRPWWVALALECVQGRLLLAKGDPERAADLYAQVELEIRRLGIGEPCAPRWAGDAIEAALAADRPSDAARIVSWLDEHGGRLPCQWPVMIARAGEAGCAAAAGDDIRADELYRQALSVPSGELLDRVHIILRYGAWLRRCNQSVRARPVLAEAVRLAEQCGASALAALSRTELAAAGGRRRNRSPDALTVQEARVARIALTGATAREIALELRVSPRTVETHLSGVYRKLALGGKRDLRARRAEVESRIADLG